MRKRGAMVRKTALLVLLVQLAACGGGSGGSSPTPPSGLSYPASPSYTVGTAITPLTPTVTGTVTSYSVSPMLPAGLSVNTSTGIISGTPSAVSPQTTYTVTASNGSGSTTDTVSIAVAAAPGAPKVTYPSLAYSFTVGAAANVAAVSTGGAVSTWSVSPSLPTGLALNAETGAITGTPAAVSAPAIYVVTAKSAGGTSKIGLTLQVVSKVLLDLGHARSISRMLFSGTRLLSQDNAIYLDEEAVSRCNLWNTATDSLVAAMQCTGQIALAGSTAVIEGPTPSVSGLQVLAATDGSLQARLTAPYSWWQLAADGSYIVIGSSSGLSVFSPTGQGLYTSAGNYAGAQVVAAPGQVLIALGPAGANVIQTVTIPGGVSTTGPAFMGTFNEWFADGSHFQTAVGTTVYTYTSASVKVDLTSLTSLAGLGGEGNYFWAYTDNGSGTFFTIYTVGASSTPTLVVTPGAPPVTVAGLIVGLGPGGGSQLTIVDLSGPSPVYQTYTLPAAVAQNGTVFAAVSASDWYVAGPGIIFDGTSLATTPKYLGYGVPTSVAGAAGVVAVATPLGIIVTNAQTNAIEVTIPFVTNEVQLSADGTVLAASQAIPNTIGYASALNIYSLPSGTVINSFSYTGGSKLVSYNLAPTGTLVAQVIQPCCSDNTQQVTAVTGGAVLWSQTQTSGAQLLQTVQFSPDGTLMAVSDNSPDNINVPQQADIATNIYQNYALSGAVTGWAVGWVTNGELLANKYTFSSQDSPFSVYAGATLYSSSGTVVASPPLPDLRNVVAINTEGSEVYSSSTNSIYALPAGTLLFGSSLYTESALSRELGAFASPYMVYAWGSQVVAVQPPQ